MSTVTRGVLYRVIVSPTEFYLAVHTPHGVKFPRSHKRAVEAYGNLPEEIIPVTDYRALTPAGGYVATVSTPGCLPIDDDPPVFDTARDAWEWLAQDRRDAEDEAWDDAYMTGTHAYSATVGDLELRASERWLVADCERVGTVYGDTPGYDGDHDLGLAYCVTEVTE